MPVLFGDWRGVRWTSRTKIDDTYSRSTAEDLLLLTTLLVLKTRTPVEKRKLK